MLQVGHEEPSLPPMPMGRFAFRRETFAGDHRSDANAPQAVTFGPTVIVPIKQPVVAVPIRV
jgi:hypothetical protein